MEKKIIIKTLEKYIRASNSKLGDFCESLLIIEGYSDCFLTEKFHVALWDEIEEQLSNFKINSKIVEETKIIKQKTTRLDWTPNPE